MSDLPELGGQRHLRVSDADRERTAEVLRNAAGEGRITFEELDERLTAAYAAKTYGDLATVTADLPGPGPQPPAAPAPGTLAEPAGGFPAERIGGSPGPGSSVAIMSGVERAGRWVVPPRHTVFALMGGVQLDLREARFSEREVTIDVFAIMGGVDIIVGHDIEVDVSGFGIMGGFDHRASGPGLPGAPRLRVVGFALMGGVGVQRRGPSKRQQRAAQLGQPEDRHREPGDYRHHELGYGPRELREEYREMRQRDRDLRREDRDLRREDRDLRRRERRYGDPDDD